MSEIVHELKVVEPYYQALVDGVKTFEVRRNDRAYQSGDVLRLQEFHPYGSNDTSGAKRCGCGFIGQREHLTGKSIQRRVSFVYSGDPRFGGIEPGFVVLALSPVVSS